MIRQAIATAQLTAAREEREGVRALLRNAFERETSIGLLWHAEDRVWFWSLQVEAGKLEQADEPGEA